MAINYRELRMFERPEITIDSLLKDNIVNALVDEKYYYIVIRTSDPYANKNYIINKQNNSIFWVHFTDLIVAGVFDNAKEITPEEFRRAVS